MIELEEESITGLVEVKKTTVLAAFTADDGLDSVVQQAKDLVAGFDHDMSTGASRKRTGSLAAKIATLKVKLDGLGKDLVSDWKAKSKVVDKSRKKMKDELDELKVLARKPLTDWEAEQEEIEAERLAKEAADKLAAEIEVGHELGLFLNADHDREVKAEAERIETIRIEYEIEIARKAAETARLEAEAKDKLIAEEVELEKQRVIKVAQDARAAKEQADRDKIAAQERAKVEAEQAEKARVEAKKNADKCILEAADIARRTELKRQEDEAARVEADRIKREEDVKHASKIMRDAKETLMQFAEIDEEAARRVVTAIKKGLINNVSIQF